MRKYLVGMLVGMALSATPAFALRFSRPPTFTEWNSNTFSQLNDTLLQMWNVTNGRITLDSLVVTPNGTRKGTKGDLVFAVFGGSNYICVNTDSSTTWKCALAT